MRPRRIHPTATVLAQAPAPIVRLWLFRIVVPMGAHQEIISRGSVNADYLTGALGLELDPEALLEDSNPARLMSALRAAYAAVEKDIAEAKAPPVVRRNMNRLARLLGLNDVDQRLLEFAVLLHTERTLDDTADWLGPLTSVKVMHVLAVILNIPEKEVRAAFAADGILARSGLLTVDKSGVGMLRAKLNLLSDLFADHIVSGDIQPVSLLRDVVFPSGPAELQLTDYAHLRRDVEFMQAYLLRALEAGRRGVNILLYGAPGTGKTQLARALAAHASCELFEIASQDSDGDAIGGGARLRAFRAAQCFLSQRPSLILFDEIEDVFDDGDALRGSRSSAQRSKAWVNRTLEENLVPAFWLSNSIDCIDPAFVRRFDMVLEVTVPPQQQRVRLMNELCGGIIDAATIRQISKVEHLAPAIVARAASVVRCAQGVNGDQPAAEAFRQLVSNTLVAQGHVPLRRNDPDCLPDLYDPVFINADADLPRLAQGLGQGSSARLCLYGPPGTGKTAFGRWLAAQLNLPLHVARGSDLLSMWVGGTEKNIARAFRNAEAEGALLLIDEVDSFLADRRGAQRSWEVTAVNEMLTQMESFPGIFIASTNLMAGLDQASLRRFDLKLRLDYLKPAQAAQLFERQCQALELGQPAETALAALCSLPNLTPGDFAVAARQHRFQPLRSPAELLLALQREAAAKEKTGPAIGFF